MTTQETNITKNASAVFGAFHIAMNRAFEQGLTPEEAIRSILDNTGQFDELINSCKNYLNSK
jgi:hypothetical protein